MANDTLRCHYGTLSQFLQYPIRVAQLLYEEGVISKITLNVVKQSLSEDAALFVLLKAVRHAVHTNYHNLVVFAGVLLKVNSNVTCAKAILKDCGKFVINIETLCDITSYNCKFVMNHTIMID